MVKNHPIFILGQNAEKAGQGGCFLYGCLTFVPFLNVYLIAKNRQMVRDQNNIDGGFGGWIWRRIWRLHRLLLWMLRHCSGKIGRRNKIYVESLKKG